MSRSRLFFALNFIFIIIILILGFWEGIFDGQPELREYNDKSVTIYGLVCEESDQSVANQKITLCVREIKIDQLQRRVSGKVLVSLDIYPHYDYGDWLLIKGYLNKPIRFPDFKYDRYLARYHIYSLMYYPQVKKMGGELNFSERLFLLLLRFKWSIRDVINKNLPEPESGLANALLLGYRRTVTTQDMTMFSRIGLSHMIAISGSHITIMSAMIINFFMGLGLSRKKSLFFVWIFLIIYPLITGLQASAVRSSIMGAFGFLSIYSTKKIPIVQALLFSATLMLIFNPKLLRDDVGFQLSFLAIMGIVYLYPIGDKLVGQRIGNRIIKSIWDVLNLTLVSQIITLPVLIINFKKLSLISPLANVLVLWVFSLLLASLIVASFIGSILPFLGLICFWPSYLLLRFIFLTSTYLSGISWAAIGVEGFNWWGGALYYLCLLILLKVYSIINAR